MPDRRVVDDLTIEELEQILIVRRRDARSERMRRLQEIGRVPADAPLPHEDLALLSAARPTAAPAAAGRGHLPALQPLGSRPSDTRDRSKPVREPRPRTKLGLLRDRLLLVLEVGALLGLVAILVVSLLNLNALNADYAQASLLPTPTATPLAGGVLPGGHSPPAEAGSVPIHLRGLVGGESLPGVPLPTAGPEAPTRVVIPAINVDALIVEGDDPEQLKLGVGHHLGSANPGERGNMVLSAHDDIYGEIFRRLHELELGDEITVYAGKQPYRYLVTAKQIVEPTEVSVLATTTRPVATLITCYPYMVDTHRVIVVAELQ